MSVPGWRTSEPQHHADVLRVLIDEHNRRKNFEDGPPFLVDDEITAIWYAIGTLESIAHPIRPGD